MKDKIFIKTGVAYISGEGLAQEVAGGTLSLQYGTDICFHAYLCEETSKYNLHLSDLKLNPQIQNVRHQGGIRCCAMI